MDKFIIVLAVVGLLMLGAEVFVPGLVLGTLGTVALILAIVLCYASYGFVIGTAAFAALSLVGTAAFLIWLRVFPRTPIGRRVTLKNTLEPSNAAITPALLGARGVAITPLRPAGTAQFDNGRVDVVAEGAFIQAGEPVEVIAQEGIRVVVRRTGSPRPVGTPD